MGDSEGERETFKIGAVQSTREFKTFWELESYVERVQQSLICLERGKLLAFQKVCSNNSSSVRIMARMVHWYLSLTPACMPFPKDYKDNGSLLVKFLFETF